jgi:uncharacterized membrane protein
MLNDDYNNMMEEQWRKDPSKWIFGIFYYNRDDKRLFPPKRIAAMGWTVNFANPYSTTAMILLLIIIIGISMLR